MGPARLERGGTTQVLTTHYMDEAEQLCDRLVVMDGGRIVAQGSPRELIAQHCSREVAELRLDADDHAALVAGVERFADRVEVLPGRLLLSADDGDAAAAAVVASGVGPMSVLVRRSSLEDAWP